MYRIKRIQGVEDVDGELANFLVESGENVAKIFSNGIGSENFTFVRYATKHLFLIVYKSDTPVGVMLARLCKSVFDYNVRILVQDLFYVKPGSGRAAHLLFQSFIDFGKANADHIFTMTTKHSNIKGRSLLRLGFEKTEESYWMEVNPSVE